MRSFPLAAFFSYNLLCAQVEFKDHVYGKVKLHPPITSSQIVKLKGLQKGLTNVGNILSQNGDLVIDSLNHSHWNFFNENGYFDSNATSLMRASYITLLYRNLMPALFDSKSCDSEFVDEKLFKDVPASVINLMISNKYSIGFSVTRTAAIPRQAIKADYIQNWKELHAYWVSSSEILFAEKNMHLSIGKNKIFDIQNKLNIWNIPIRVEEKGIFKNMNVDNNFFTALIPWPQIYLKSNSMPTIRFRSQTPLSAFTVLIYPLTHRKDILDDVPAYGWYKRPSNASGLSVKVKLSSNIFITEDKNWAGMYGISADFNTLEDGLYLVALVPSKIGYDQISSTDFIHPIRGAVFQVGGSPPFNSTDAHYSF